MKPLPKSTRTVVWLIVFAVCLNAGINHIGVVSSSVAYFFGLLSPVLVGFIFAFLLSIPVNALEKRIIRPHGKRALRFQKGFQRPLSIIVSIALIICVFVFVGFTVLPTLAESLHDLVMNLDSIVAGIKEDIRPYIQGNAKLSEWVNGLHIDGAKIEQSIVGGLMGSDESVVAEIISTAFSVFGKMFSMMMALVIGVSAVYHKEKLARQSEKLLRSCVCDEKASKVVAFVRKVGQTFSAFFTGQILEAIILGAMVAVGMVIFGFPHAPVIGMLVSLMALIPIIGAWISAIVGAVMVFSSQGILSALGFIILIIVLQQIEGNIIYPKVMGKRVGLPALWMLVAFTVGRGLFGLWGMLLAIPLFAVGYQLLRDFAEHRSNKAGNTA